MRQVSLILSLRIRQLYRLLSGLGWRAAIFLPLAAALLVYVIKTLTDKGPLYLNLAVFALVFAAEQMRKDAPFTSLLKRNGILLRLFEYGMVIVLCNLYASWLSPNNSIYMGGNLLVMIAMVLLSQNRGQYKVPSIARKLTGLLPAELYELKFGIRQVFLLIVVLWVVALVASFWGPVVPFFILLMPLLLMDHISYAEPREITQSYRLVANALNRKMLKLGLAFFMLFIPQLIISFIYRPDGMIAVAVLAAFWVGLSTVYYALLLRYSDAGGAGYQLSKSIRVFLFLVVSPLLPVSIYLLYRQYKIAKWNLQPLLN